MSPDQIVTQFNKLDGERATLKTQYQTLAQYIMPSESYFTTDKYVPGTMHEDLRVFDSTAMGAADVLASSLHGGVTPAMAQWFKFRLRGVPTPSKETDIWLEDSEEKIMNALSESNFITAIAQLFIEYVVFGTACLYVENHSDDLAFGRFKFTNVHLSNLVFKEGPSGRAEYVWIKSKMAAQVILDTYGDEADALTNIRKAVGNPKTQFKEFELITYIRLSDKKHSKPSAEGKADGGEYTISVVCVDDKVLLGEEKYLNYMPVMVPRWQKAYGQVWGVGPGTRALPTVLVVNRAEQLEMAAWDRAVNSGYKTTEDNLVDNSVDPSGVNVMNDINDFADLNDGNVQWNVAGMKKEEGKNAIRTIFFEDRLVMQSTGGDTATEFRLRFELLQRLIGPTMGRISAELLNPMVECFYHIGKDTMMLEPAPGEAAESNNLDIEYVSPLAKAQKMPEVEASSQFIAMLQQYEDFYPGVRHLIDIEKDLRNTANILGVAADSLRDTKEYEAKIADDQRQQQEAIAAEQQAQGGGPQPPQQQLSAVPGGA
jgi:hypothetical protein